MKLIGIERKSHVMDLVMDQAIALFCWNQRRPQRSLPAAVLFGAWTTRPVCD